MATLTTIRKSYLPYPRDPSSWYRPDKTTPENAAGQTGGSYPPDGQVRPSRVWNAHGQLWQKDAPSMTAPINFRQDYHAGTPGVGQTWIGGTVSSDADPVNALWEADVDEEQRIQFGAGVTSGTFRLNIVGAQTATITFSTDESTLETNIRNAIEALPNVDPGEITVSDDGTRAWSLKFRGRYSRTPQELVTISNSTLVGGTMTTVLEQPGTPAQFHWHSHYGMLASIPEIRILGTHFHNCGDALDFGGNTLGSPWFMHGCKFTDIHDDAVQNDKNRGGWMQNCLFDGVTAFVSCQNSTADGTSNTIIIANCMIRLKPFYQSYKPWKYGHNQHGSWFKTFNPATAPKLLIRNCIFRADQPAAYGAPQGGSGPLRLPESVVDIQDVLLINTDSWGSGSLDSWNSKASGVRFGTTADWDYHVNRWNPMYAPDLDATL